MNTLVALSQTKTQLIEALSLLPSTTVLPQDDNLSHFESLNLSPMIVQDIEQLNEFWDFVENYYHLKVIALVGMVNVGKSALGNYLLNRGESEVFQEAPIRETSDAKEAKLDENTVIFDLPGLGSVLSDEDDEVVTRILNRANLLLMVLDCNYPIPNHLYEFLKSDQVIKTDALQKVVIIINKIDCLSDLPEHIQNKKIKKYIDFLYYGDSKMNFSGIANLFNYEIPVVPFSVSQARKYSDYSLEKQLRKEINEALKSNHDGVLNRTIYKLYDLSRKYIPLAINYIELDKKQEHLSDKAEAIATAITNGTEQLIDREVENVASRLQRIRERCFDELNTYGTTDAERFWQGDNFTRKKNASKSCKDRYQEEIIKEFVNFATNLQVSLSFMGQNFLGETIHVTLPEYESILSSLKSSIYEIWDAFDDYFFLDKDHDTFTHSLNQSQEYFEKAADEFSDWYSKFKQDFYDTLKVKCENVSPFKEYIFFSEQASALEAFFKSFISIDLVQAMLSDDSQ
ncbi:MAG: 50S ribosome-binding GTPase [Crocosphaera sp.]|nr:50S ribosome-binding GTPase [Crocosphaera sp.]